MHDWQLAFRGFRAFPVVTVVAVLSLALGIGANTAIFSLVNSLLLRPLPVTNPQRLAIVSDARGSRLGFPASWTYAVWDEIRKRPQPFDGACAWFASRVNLAAHGGETDGVDAVWVSGSYFGTLGVAPLLGRMISVDDDSDGNGEAVAVLSYELWQRRFGGAASVIGSPIVVEQVPFTIVGVAPPGFFGAEVGRAFDLALPINADRLIHGAETLLSRQRGFYAFSVMLRLKASQSVDEATTILRGLQPQIREAAMPTMLPAPIQKEFLKDPFVVVPAATGTSRLRVRYERPLVVMLVVVGLVLLVACANIANLQLARATARRHDTSVRVALGAAPWHLVRQSLTESLLLAVSGAGLGLLFAAWSSRLLVAQLSTWLNRIYLDLSIDWRVLVFTATIAATTTVLFGLFAAVRNSRVAPIEVLKEQTRGTSSDSRVWMSNALIASQVALSIVIVFAAGLFVRSFVKLATVPLGFEEDRVLLVDINMDRTHVRPADREEFIDRVAREVAQLPSVTAASGSAITPVQGLGLVDIVHIPGIPLSFDPMPGGRLNPHATYLNVVTPGWFATYGMPIKAGRDFNDHDVKGAPRAIIVNDAFVRKFLHTASPIGATVAFERGTGVPVQKTIVGVVSDAAYNLPRPAAAAAEWLGQGRMGRVGEQPRALLHADRRRPQAARGGAARLRPAHPRDPQGAQYDVEGRTGFLQR